MRVLLVDNQVMFREGLKILLDSETDIEVVGEAGTTRDAVDLARTLEPDLVLMDVNLPDAPGFNAVKTLQMQQPEINIVILTNKDQDDLLLEAILLGAKGFILKNLSIAKLVASIRGLERGEMALSRLLISRVLKKLVCSYVGSEPTVQGLDQLSKREREVLAILVKGDSNREIASQLFISENTVKKHVRSILEKLNQKNRNQVVLLARQTNFSAPEERPPSDD
ncbi:MAG: DNA-binding response regulator [Chloroflexota bacterium]|nr:MAG: DNA-binding response regulator [Chloroflexota bacterium]